MITTKKELIEYLQSDALANNRVDWHIHLNDDPIWKFLYYRRVLDYIHFLRNKSHFYSLIRLIYKYYRKKYERLSIKLGFTMSYRGIGKGFSIAHYGLCVINGGCQIGENFRVHEGVTIGSTNGSDAPVIGNNVFVGSGAKIIGAIKIADDVAIGAGAVVVKDILEPGTTWAGVPAKKISDNDSHSNLSQNLFIN